MALTLIQIVDASLDQAGLDSGFRSKARQWLNLILQDLSGDFDWPEWNKLSPYVPFVAGQKSYSLPADFEHADTLYLYNINADGDEVQQEAIRIYDSYRFDAANFFNVNGRPSAVMVDEMNSNLIFNSAPSDSAYGYKLRYFKQAPQYDITGTDDAEIPEFKDQNYLIKELVKWAYEFQDDERYQAKNQENDQKLKKVQRNIYQANDSTGQMPLNTFWYRPRVRR